MNSMLESGLLEEMPCENNFAYILKDNTAFSSTEYKVMQSKADGVFVRMMKLLYNGQIQFYYLISGYRTFQSMIPMMDADAFLTITANIFAGVIDVQNNGFLSCRNVDASFGKIFVDPNTYQVKLIYLPSVKRFYPDDASFENELRTSLVKLIADLPSLSSPKTTQLMSDLQNGMYGMTDIYNRIKGGGRRTMGGNRSSGGNNAGTGVSDGVHHFGGHLKIVALNAPYRIELAVTKEHYLIGRKSESVDGAVSFNKMIGRVHCRIDQLPDGSYCIVDLNSSNGTYVNHVRVRPDTPTPIHGGDVIRLANSDFQVVME